MLKAVILDFDGTLVKKDILDVICGIVGKEEESSIINNEVHSGIRTGLSHLIQRINFLKGVSVLDIENKLKENPYLMDGAKELMEFLNKKNIVSILSSGNILPVLQYYQKTLGFNYVVGSRPKMENDVIKGITEEAFSDRNFKITDVIKILGELSIPQELTLAIGDSPVDKVIFDYTNISIAINPKQGIEKHVDYVIENDLRRAIPIIEKYL